MDKPKILKRLFSGVLIGGLLLTTGGLVIADEQTTGQSNSKPVIKGERIPGKGPGPVMAQLSEDVLTQLVTAGTITQDQADKLLALINAQAAERQAQEEKFNSMTEEERQAELEERKAKAEEFKNLSDEEKEALKDEINGKRGDILSQAVSSGILTETEADAVKSGIHEIIEQKRLDEQEKQLSELVAAGSITQEQADKLLVLAEANAAERKAQAEKFASMTEEERQALREEQKARAEEFKNLTNEEKQALMDEQKGKKGNLFNQGVNEGILTQEEANSIIESIREKVDQARNEEMQSKIDALVSAGTITSEQAATILENINKKPSKARFERTDVNKSAVKQSKGERPSPFADLVTDGTLTQDQADSVSKAMQSSTGGRLGGHGGPGNAGGPGGPGRR